MGMILNGIGKPLDCDSYRDLIVWANYNDVARRVVTLNGGLVRESSHNPLNSGLGIILICPVIVVTLR